MMFEFFIAIIAIPLAMQLSLLIMSKVIQYSTESETNKANRTAILDDDGTEIDPFNFRLGDDGEIE